METLKIILVVAILLVGFLVYREAVNLGNTIQQQQQNQLDQIQK